MKVEVIERDGVEMRVDTCKGCGKPFEQERKQGRPRQKCDTCNGTAAPTVLQPSEHVIKTDPPLRADGRCACGCGKTLPRTKQARQYAGVQLDVDPFATSDCCKRFYGVAWATDPDDDAAAERRARGGRAAAQRRLGQRGWKEPGTVPVEIA